MEQYQVSTCVKNQKNILFLWSATLFEEIYPQGLAWNICSVGTEQIFAEHTNTYDFLKLATIRYITIEELNIMELLNKMLTNIMQ